MSFLDHVTIHIESGSGGNGAIAWRREKYVAYGGPAGGDGGRGGSLYLEASDKKQTLIDYRFKHHFTADAGGKGQSKDCHGRGAEDMLLEVPVGTVIKDAENGQILADLAEVGQRVLVAQGGRGGRGNARFGNSRNKTPFFAEPGEAGIIRDLRLELKLIADIGLVGLPNAGKSTLISVLSAAKPKIAPYPFTTLVPNLGVVRTPLGDGVVLADIPGLIEGASQGVGLGHDFLRHVERCRLLFHLVDATATDGGTPWGNYRVIQEELSLYSEILANKPQIVMLTKADSIPEDERDALKAQFLQETGVLECHFISSPLKLGTDALMHAGLKRLETLPKVQPTLVCDVDTKATDNDDSLFEINALDDNIWEIDGGKIHRWMAVTDLNTPLSLRRFWIVLKGLGVFKELNKRGAKAGDTIYIGDEDFEYDPDQFSEGPHFSSEDESPWAEGELAWYEDAEEEPEASAAEEPPVAETP